VFTDFKEQLRIKPSPLAIDDLPKLLRSSFDQLCESAKFIVSTHWHSHKWVAYNRPELAAINKEQLMPIRRVIWLIISPRLENAARG
jgi:hypothetical protein